jgi:hypothetical protein
MRCGAGRPGWHAKTAGTLQLDVRQLQRQGAFAHAAATVGLTWASGAAVKVDTSPDAATLVYRYKDRQGGWRDVNQRVNITRTPCHYGGERPWFICPRCSGRVAILYLWNVPLCRTCAKLVYPSQAEDAIGRSWRRSRKIAARLGQKADAWMTPRRPKGMRQATFERLREQWWAEERLRDDMLAAFVGRMGLRL